MDKCSDCMPKGTYTPVLSNESSNNLLLLIPSWLTQYGLFSDKEGRDSKRKRKRQQLNSSTTDCAESKNNIHQLISNEIRQCDVCGRSIVWTPTLQKQFFFLPHSVTSSNDDIFQQSVAESLPHFIERYITTKSSSPLPCSFCTASTASSDVDWCGSLYCSKDCQIQGEEKCMLYHPKLFFCQNRFGSGGCIGSSNTNEHDELIIKEIRESIAAIEKKFKDICGYDTISIGIEECALLLMTIISCTYHTNNNWMNDFLEEEKNTGKNQLQESLIELWAMSKSHHSNFLLLKNSNTEHENTTTSNSTFLPYQEFFQGYLFIKRHCILRVSSAPTHPLVSYAKAIVSNALSEEEMGLALDVLNSSCSSRQPHAQKKESNSGDIQSTILRWRTATHFAHWISAPSAESDESKQISAQLRKSYFVFSPIMFRQKRHSCAPTLALTTPADKSNDTNQQSPLDTLAWLALHDIISGDMSVSKINSLDEDVKARSIELKKLMGQDYVCSCIRCQYETASSDTVVCLGEGGGKSSEQVLYLRRYQLKRLADLAMQQARFEDASKLHNCILQTFPNDGEALHAKAASYLGRASSISFTSQGHCNGNFLKAQRLWKIASELSPRHPEISIQMTKQHVYKTLIFDEEEGGSETDSTLSFASYLEGKCFLTTEQVISIKECQDVIRSAEQYATTSGWTTSRHHEVPTTDLPLHELVDLHSWFYQRWNATIRPLLRMQFQLKSKKLNRDIFLHDAFVVRYDTDRQRYLPPHYDESTHSFIISLNSDFKGGGTYMHPLGKTLSPSVGGMLTFSGGEILHSGDPTVCGVRYILAAFCYVDVIEETDNTLKEEKEPKLHVFGSKSSEITSQEKEEQSFSFGFRV